MQRSRGRHLAQRIRRTYTPTRALALALCLTLVMGAVAWADTVLTTDAVDDSATVAINSGASPIAVLANDTVIDGGTLTITEATQGASGAVTITNGGADLTYEPSLDFCGPDSFTYTISDGLDGTDIATVTIEVTCAPPPEETTTTTAAAPVDETTTTTVAAPSEETTTTTAAPPVEETTTTAAAPLPEETTTTTTVPAAPVLDLSTAANLIVKLVAGLSPEQQAAVIVSHGGVETAVIDVLRLHMVAVALETVDDSIAAFAADPAVVSVDADISRTAGAQRSSLCGSVGAAPHWLGRRLWRRRPIRQFDYCCA